MSDEQITSLLAELSAKIDILTESIEDLKKEFELDV